MVVAKRQRREKPAKIEQRKVQGPEWGPQVKQTALLASPIYIGQATTDVEGMCNFLGSVSSQQKFEAMNGPPLQPSDGPVSQPSDRPVLQPSNRKVLQLWVTAQFYLESKGKYIFKAWGNADPKHAKRREVPAQFWLLFLYVFSPPPGPALCTFC